MNAGEHKIRFAVIGYGHIGKRHARIISHHPQAELTGIIDINDGTVLNIEPPNTPLFNSIDSFFQSGIEADVINIATPNYLHASQAITCLQQGKHVVIEKPMALHTEDAESIVATAKQFKKQVFVVKQNRYSPPVAWLKEVVEKNILGKIYSVQLNCFWNRDERYYTNNNWHCRKETDGGCLFTQFSHFIDIFYWLFGDIKNIRSSFRSFNHNQLTNFEDSGIAMFEFGENSLGCLHFSTAVWNKNFESSITVIAENGSVKIGGQYMDSVEYCQIKDYAMPQLNIAPAADTYGGYTGSAANHQWVIQNVIDVLHHKKPVTTSAKEGMKVVDMIERIYKACN